MKPKNITLDGSLALLYHNNIDELATILSKEIFGGVQFTGKELKTRDEFSSVFINDFFGIKIELMDSGGVKNSFYENKEYFYINFSGRIINNEIDSFESIKISDYLHFLFKSKLAAYKIEVIKLPLDKNKYPNL